VDPLAPKRVEAIAHAMSAPEPSATAEPALTPAEEQRYAELQLMALDFARNGETETLVSMLRSGLAPNLADHKGNTLLMLAAYHGQHTTAQALLDFGAEIDRPNDHGQTPLGGVAFKGDIPLAELLLAHGAALEADNGMGMTPLMFAAMFGRHEMVELLRRRGASLRRRTRFGLSAAFLVRLARALHRLRTLFRARSRASVQTT